MSDTEWTGPEGQRADRPIHVVPVNDLREHVTDGDPCLCPCIPMTLHPQPKFVDGVLCQPDDSHSIVRHNSYDRREVGAVCRKALDALGVALSDHDHEWSPDLRDAFDHAIHLLNIHWPPK